MTVSKPWQLTPKSLLEYGLAHLQEGDETNHQIAFLFIDLAVETLFKTFLLLPSNVTKSQLSFQKRKTAASGNFHQVVTGVSEAAGARLGSLDMTSIEYYHGIRNKLYHSGDGVVPRSGFVEEYANLASDLFLRLLDVTVPVPRTIPKSVSEELIQALQLELESFQGKIRARLLPVRRELLQLMKEAELRLAETVHAEEVDEYLRKMNSPELVRWKQALRSLLDNNLYLLDDKHEPVTSVSIDYFDSFTIFMDLVSSFPVFPWPKCIEQLLEWVESSSGDLDVWMSILFAVDSTDLMLVVTDKLLKQKVPVSQSDYRRAVEYLHLDVKRILETDSHDSAVQRIRTHGQEIVGLLT